MVVVFSQLQLNRLLVNKDLPLLMMKNTTSTQNSQLKDDNKKRKEIYTYEAPWMIYGMGWSVRRDKPYRLAIGSFIEEYSNKVEVVQINDEKNCFEKKGSFDHPYPTTKIMWLPDTSTSKPDLLATTGDYLRIWQVKEKSIELKCCLNNVSEESVIVDYV
jgi:WD repeat-containing protein 68